MQQPAISSKSVPSKPLMEKIIQATCDYSGFTEEQLCTKNGPNDVVYYRKLAYYLIKSDVVISLERIANRFGFSSHKPVWMAVEEITAHKNIYPQVRNDLNEILKIVNTL